MFAAGEAVGASDLSLVARNERGWGAQVRVDNQGDDHTGSERVFVDGSWFDPSGRGDALSIGALATRNPENSYYGYLGYDTPLQGLKTRLHTRVSRDQFDYSNNASEQNGTADTAEIGVTQVLARSRGDEAKVAVHTSTRWTRLPGRTTHRHVDGPCRIPESTLGTINSRRRT
jgi:hemolysin activation/secretion protein